MKTFLRSKKGQGSTEYIVIIAMAVLFLTLTFWSRIRPLLENKVGQISSGINNAR